MVLAICVPRICASPAVAVVDLEARNLPVDDARILSDRLRHELIALGKYTVVERGEMEAILGEQGFQQSGCTSQECVVEMGQLLGATHMVAGSVGKLGDLYMITVRMVDVASGTVLRAAEASVEGAIELLVKTAIPSVARQLSCMVQDSVSETAAATAAQPPPEPPPADMVWVAPGEFTMGSSTSMGLRKAPTHQVYLDGFFIDKYEVTQEQFEKASGKNPSKHDKCPTCPVESVTFRMAESYCRAQGKRLPTEAEWEKACKAGSNADYPWGSNPDMMGDYAWYIENASTKIFGTLRASAGERPVGQKKPNAYGIYDMVGNVFELVSDYWDRDYYEQSPRDNPTGPQQGNNHVCRGGYYKSAAPYANCVWRGMTTEGYGVHLIGFRCARSPGAK
jgi:sulfatase modifying factor 1